VDVKNAVISLQQARARYETAVATRVLAQQTLDAEQKKFQFGTSSIRWWCRRSATSTTTKARDPVHGELHAR